MAYSLQPKPQQPGQLCRMTRILPLSLIISASICLIISGCSSPAPIVQQLDLSTFKKQSLPADLIIAKAVKNVDLSALASGSQAALERQTRLAQQTGLPVTAKARVSGITLSLVPPGTFQMGSGKWEDGRDKDENQHAVTISRPFYIGKFEVTQKQWEALMGTNPSKFNNAKGSAPVEMISWNDSVEFCKALCLQENVPQGTYRLPTEAEWEYACRAGTETPFCYGKKLTAQMAHFDQMPYVGNTSTIPVGNFLPNAWGLHDMHGNVYEWCQDWYGDYTGASAVDPTGPRNGEKRLSRGGGWGIQSSYCRSANRCGDAKPEHKMFALGLRIVREIQIR